MGNYIGGNECIVGMISVSDGGYVIVCHCETNEKKRREEDENRKELKVALIP